MKRVIVYGTFDVLHYGHIRFLKQAKALGDYLIVGLSTDAFNKVKHKQSYFSYNQRKTLLEAIRYVDLIIPENTWEQKISDIKKYEVDVLCMGDDWEGRFDELKKEGVKVVYLKRPRKISSSKIKTDFEKIGYKKAEKVWKIISKGATVNLNKGKEKNEKD